MKECFFTVIVVHSMYICSLLFAACVRARVRHQYIAMHLVAFVMYVTGHMGLCHGTELGIIVGE